MPMSNIAEPAHAPDHTTSRSVTDVLTFKRRVGWYFMWECAGASRRPLPPRRPAPLGASRPRAPRLSIGGTAPALRVPLGVEPEHLEEQEPDDEAEGAPGPARDEAPPGGAERGANQHGPPLPLQPPRQVQVLQKRQVPVPAHASEGAGPDEDALITVVVACQPVADPVDPGDHAEAPAGLGEQVLERAADHQGIRQRLADQREGGHGREGIRVEEEQGVAARLRRPRIHQGRASGASGPKDAPPSGGDPRRALGIARSGHDHLRLRDTRETLEPVESAAECRGVVPAGHDDGHARRHARGLIPGARPRSAAYAARPSPPSPRARPGAALGLGPCPRRTSAGATPRRARAHEPAAWSPGAPPKCSMARPRTPPAAPLAIRPGSSRRPRSAPAPDPCRPSRSDPAPGGGTPWAGWAYRYR